MVRPTSGVTGVYDLDLERRVVNYLWGRNVAALRQIEVHANRGTVTLCGAVESFYQKQLCLNCSRRVAGVTHLVDQLQVAAEPAVSEPVWA